jgi:outer membrane lipoprotein-sorting protein
MIKVAVSVSCCVLLASSARAESADDILKRWDIAAKDFHAFSADLKQTSYTKVVNKSEHQTAVVRLKRTDKGVFGIVRYTSENQHTIHFAGDAVEDYHPVANQLDSINVKKYSSAIRDGLMLGFGTSGKDVKNGYVVKDAVSEMIGSRRTTRIELIPKDKNAKDYAEKVELWIPEGENNPIQAKSTEPGGNYELFEYSNVKLLKLPLKDSDFDFERDQMPNKTTHYTKN